MTECGSRYVLGLRFVKIALTGKSDAHVINAVSATLQALVKDLGETAFLARYRGGRVDLIHVETPTDPALSYVYPGLGPKPAQAWSAGKVIAAFVAPDLRRELLAGARDRLGGATATDSAGIERELTEVRRTGYAVCDGAIEAGVASVAVPVNIDRLGAIFAIGVVNWCPLARLTRAEFLRLRNQEFVMAVRAAGGRDLRIILRTILPNALPPLVISITLLVGICILFEAALSFLGLTDPDLMTWGLMIGSSRDYFWEAWWTVTIPGAAILITVLCIALIGDGLNDALNPRLRKR